MSGSAGRRSVARLLVAIQVFLLVASFFAPVASLAAEPSDDPGATPSAEPSAEPTPEPTPEPTAEPTAEPTPSPPPSPPPSRPPSRRLSPRRADCRAHGRADCRADGRPDPEPTAAPTQAARPPAPQRPRSGASKDDYARRQWVDTYGPAGCRRNRPRLHQRRRRQPLEPYGDVAADAPTARSRRVHPALLVRRDLPRDRDRQPVRARARRRFTDDQLRQSSTNSQQRSSAA